MSACNWLVDDPLAERGCRPCGNSGTERLGDRSFCITHVRKMEHVILNLVEVDPKFRDNLIRQIQRADIEEAAVWTQHRKAIRQWPAAVPPRAHAVYFIERDGFCKIGRAADVEKRAKEIARGSSMPDGMTVGPVRVLAEIYCICPSLCVRERFFQKRFQHLHYHLEWFLLDAELRNFIGGLDGCLDDELREASFRPPAGMTTIDRRMA